MRILAIRGRNLASLADPFELDLDVPPLSRTGLFAITGPTGAGKSTILDALCLALFDRVPRLPGSGGVAVGRAGDDPRLRVRSGDVRSILRRGAGSGHAEVDFIGRDRRRYRARWEVRRARGRPDGRLQPQVMTLQDLASGATLGEGKSDTLAEIHERLGLSFEQFRRSALLAQGDFAAFLKAGHGDRSSLLERITGTELYSRLSRAAFARAGQEEAALARLRERLGEWRPLATDERVSLERQREVLERRWREKEQVLEQARERRRWQRTREALAGELAEAEREVEQASRRWRQAEAARAELAAVEAAAPLRPLLNRLQELDRELDRARRQRDRAVAAGRVAEAWAPRMGTARALVARLAQALEKETGRWAPRLERARELAREITGQRRAEEALADDLEAATQALQKVMDDIQKDSQSIDRTNNDLSGIDRWMASAPGLESIAGQWEQWLERAETTASRLLQERQRLTGLEADLARARRDLVRAEQALMRALAAADDASIERLRQGLRPGVPCPVCGAEAHPWAEREGDSAGDGSGRPQPRVAEGEVESARAEQAHRRDRVASLEARLQEQQRALDRMERDYAGFVTTQADTLGELAPGWGEETPGPDELTAWARALDERVQQWRVRERRREALLSRRQELERTLEGKRLLREERAARVVELEADRERIRQQLAALERDHAALLGGRSAEQVAARLEGVRREVGRQRETLEVRYQEGRRRQALAAQARRHWEERVRQLEATRDTVERDLARSLAALGIDRDELLRRLRRDTDWVAQRRREQAALQEALARWETLLTERRQRLEAHLAAGDAAWPAVEQPALDALEAEGRELQRELIACSARLSRDDQCRQRSAELAEELARQERHWRRWAELNELIGSHDGKKFRAFAQGLTLELLLAHANEQLRELSRRYLLQRVPESDLEIQVVDRDMGDEVRSVHSLSGGESFIVSLALALGLASLSSDRVQVESLFIDEGFGTLDQESLDLTVAALDALQSLGRQVGVISHVPALVERIGVRVVVERLGEGRGRVHVESV